MKSRSKLKTVFRSIALFAALGLPAVVTLIAEPPGIAKGVEQFPNVANDADLDCDADKVGSPYFPVDNWIYPAVLRLYSMGYLDGVFLGLRPWTRQNVSEMLEEARDNIADADSSPLNDEAQSIVDALTRELSLDSAEPCQSGKGSARIDSTYSVARAISGISLRDSYHLGSTIINDYGRPFESGFSNYSGASGYVTAGRFVLYARGEFQGTPSGAGYSSTLTSKLSSIDSTNSYFAPECWLNSSQCTPLPASLQTTMPAGPVASTTHLRLEEAYVSAQYLNHVFSFGKQDDWLGPGLGGGMAYSNNAENIYAFHINRIEPLNVPFVSVLTGPFRYEFLVGPLKGHTYPIDPWVHVEKVSFRPTRDLEFGFERTVIWGGKGHEPITLKSFVRSFFSVTSPKEKGVKDSPQDPGARFGAFDFSYRLPFVRNWLTLYSDSEVHDDVSPIDAPRRSSWRPGLYLSHVPRIPKLDVRIEGVSTNPPIRDLNGNLWVGNLMYWEVIQRQGYTNNGQILGDWIGRQGKGGQGWITYHLSGNEWVQVGLRNQKVSKDFIPGGTTLNDIDVQVVKRIKKDLEINGRFKYEHWKAPIYMPGQQTVTATTIELTWFPGKKVDF